MNAETARLAWDLMQEYDDLRDDIMNLRDAVGSVHPEALVARCDLDWSRFRVSQFAAKVQRLEDAKLVDPAFGEVVLPKATRRLIDKLVEPYNKVIRRRRLGAGATDTAEVEPDAR